MAEFSLDKRFLNDCHVITESGGFSYLLHSNAEVSWFILVPHTGHTEFYQLDVTLQNQLCGQINLLSDFIMLHFDSDKINVAMIGNVVPQMHIHVIGRRRDDAYWPDVVWGKEYVQNYNAKQISSISDQLISFLNSNKN